MPKVPNPQPVEYENVPNENCLEGLACPECGSTEPFLISATACVKMWDDGQDETPDVEWEDDSHITCCSCEHSATVKDFTLAEGQ